MGAAVHEADLKEAIVAVNRVRSAIQTLYKKRLKAPHAMSYSELRLLIRECLSTAPEEALGRVKRAVKALRNAPSPSVPAGPMVLVTSSTLDQVGLLKLIEGTGMTVVWDDHCSGLRHYEELVPEEGDPYANLAKRYLERWPCARMHGNPSHLQRLAQEIEAVEAQGVIHVGLKYCDQASFDVPRLQVQLKKRHIPFLYIENDYTEGALGQLKVRLEAFAEMLRGEE
jgi:benzoyl-CoA reductase/2-hydroxyglutaryl-CoA dehydratase subunit BcrC/BadD/HgdB